MKRGFLVVVGGAAIVVAGLSGCSSDTKKAESGGATASAGSGEAKVSIDGKDQTISGSIGCTKAAGNVSLGIGEGMSAIAVILTDADPPEVTSVGLGNIDGVTLGYTKGAPGGTAEVTKDGEKYTVKGTATGVDTANPMQPVTKPFEIEITCPS